MWARTDEQQEVLEVSGDVVRRVETLLLIGDDDSRRLVAAVAQLFHLPHEMTSPIVHAIQHTYMYNVLAIKMSLLKIGYLQRHLYYKIRNQVVKLRHVEFL